MNGYSSFFYPTIPCFKLRRPHEHHFQYGVGTTPVHAMGTKQNTSLLFVLCHCVTIQSVLWQREMTILTVGTIRIPFERSYKYEHKL